MPTKGWVPVGSGLTTPLSCADRQCLDLVVMTDAASQHRVLQLHLEKVGMCKGAFCADRPAKQDGPRPL